MANQDVKIAIKAVDKTKPGFSSVTGGLKKITGAIFNMKSALLGAVGVGGLGLLVQRSLQATDALSKTAIRLNTTTEALSKLHFAAELSGVSTETMNMAMQRFTRRTAEAARGTGEARGALRELNLNAADLARLPLEEQMIKLAQAFDENVPAVDRTRIAMKLFDSEGVALLQTLDSGATGLRDMFKEAEMLGLVMSNDAALGVAQANDAMSKMRMTMGALVDQFVAALAPAIESGVTAFQDYVAELVKTEGGFKNLAKVVAINVLTAFRDALQGAEDFVNGIIGAINDFNKFVSRMLPGLERFRKQIEEVDISDTINAIDKMIGVVGNLGESTSSTGTGLKEAFDPSTMEIFRQAAVRAFDGISEAIENTGQQTLKITARIEKLANKTMDDLTDSLFNAAAGTANLAASFRKMAASIIEDLTKMLIRYLVVEPLFAALTGGASTALGKKAPEIINSVPGRAIGGPVQAGSPYMVGERGPEMFIPNSSGSIVPNDKMGGGITVVNNVDATGAGQDVDVKIRAAMQQASQQTILSIQDLMRRRRFV
ncbi:MAG: phage tail tape measure C-terminal domain-containing protein [Candidatus Puniceispirillaceae bacterium]